MCRVVLVVRICKDLMKTVERLTLEKIFVCWFDRIELDIAM